RGPGSASLPRTGTGSTRAASAAEFLRAHFRSENRASGEGLTRLLRTRTSRSETLRASRVHRPSHLALGSRSRVRHRPHPGGGGAGGRPEESAPRILLVDDERAIRTICRFNLEGEGLTVTEAGDGAEALEEVKRHRPSLVLLDVMMPGID